MEKRIIVIALFYLTTISVIAIPKTVKSRSKRPDFILIGVTKCGTTSLYDYLIKHPKILGTITDPKKPGCKKKELHFFDSTINYSKGIAWYNRQFSLKTNSDELVGEATPGYFWKEGCTERIFKYCSSTKLIVIFRNPVKRVISEYFRLKQRGVEYLNFDQALLQPAMQDRYLGAGRYIEHLDRWLSFFPKDQLLILILEDLAECPEKEVNKVFRFLGVKEHTLDSYAVRNQATYDSSEIQAESIAYLKRYYEPYNKKLEAFLGRTLPW